MAGKSKEPETKKIKPGKEKLEPPLKEAQNKMSKEGARAINFDEFTSREEKEAYETLFVKKGNVGSGYEELHGSKIHSYDRYNECERAIRFAIKKGFTGKFMKTAVDMMVACRMDTEYQSWSHSVCHLFEHGDIFPTGRVDLMKKLVDESVKGAINSSNIGCTNRTLEGILGHNLAKIDPSNLDAPLALSFKSITDKKFIELLKSGSDAKYNSPQVAMCTAITQKELILSLLDDPEGLRCYIKSDGTLGIGYAKLMQVLLALTPEIGEERSNGFLQALVKNRELTVRSVADNLKALAAGTQAEEVAGVYVDVDGTLIINGKLKKRVVECMAEYKNKGKTVRIFTGGNPTEKEKVLKKFKELEGIAEFPVLSKDAFKGKLLEVVIDDTVPEVQGFEAKKHVNPNVF